MAAAAARAEVQDLLRFLTKEAGVPLATALLKIGALRKNGLNTPDAIAKSEPSVLAETLDDAKLLKQIKNAAKRHASPRKRAASSDELLVAKRSRTDTQTNQDVEVNLALPTVEITEEELQQVDVATNRAPLFLAFAVTVLKYTMPAQPLSSRLSLAQAVVSANAQSKARSIGIAPGATAQEEGWTQGQPKLKLLGREIAVMRRHYEVPIKEEGSQQTVKAEESSTHETFWGLDIEALRTSNGPLVAGRLAGSQGPPIHSPQAARSYLLRSITPLGTSSTAASKKKRTPLEMIEDKERAVAMTLHAIDLLCRSWASTLPSEELDRKAWSWYVSVRPEVAQGQKGWGQKGSVRLADILKHRRTP